MYEYQAERPKLFTEDGLDRVIKTRDDALRMIEQSGAVMVDKVIGSDVYLNEALTIVDYLVERGDIREVTGPGVAGQHRVFVSNREETP